MGSVRVPRAGVVSRCAAALGVVALSLVLVVTAPGGTPPAAAWTGTAPSPPSVSNGAVKEIPYTKVVTTAGRMSPWLKVPQMVIGAFSLYDTVQPLLDGNPESGGGDQPASGNNPNSACWSPSGDVVLSGDPVGRTWSLPYVANCGSGGTAHQYRTWCKSPTGTIVSLQTGSNPTTGWIPTNSPGTLTTTCTTGYSVAQVVVYTGGINGIVRYIWTGAFPKEDHQRTTSVKCRKPDGTFETISDTMQGRPGEVAIPSCWDRVGPDSTPWEVTGTSGPSWAPNQVRDFTAAVDDTILTDYPDCFANGALSCVVKVWVNGSACNAGRSVCFDWYDYRNDPDTNIQCRFGSYVIGIGQCTKLKDSYKPKTTTQVQVGTNPDGTPIWNTDIDPPTNPSTGPTPTPAPTAGPNPENPPTDPDPETDPDSPSCFGTGWSWNPVSWVYVPIKCAFLWAFVPSPGFLNDKFTGLRDDFLGTQPGAWVDGLIGQGFTFPSSSCDGIPVEWSTSGRDFSFTLLRACSGAMATAANVTRLVGSGFLVVFGALGCVRALGSGFGWSPGVGRGDS